MLLYTFKAEDNRTNLRIMCPEGHEYSIQRLSIFTSLKRRCKQCFSISRRTPYSDIYHLFQEKGATLLTKESEYEGNMHSYVFYICERCKKKHRTSPKMYQEGHRSCREHLYGKNNYRWNPSKTKEQRIKDRKHYKTQHWRNKVFERDNYTCQKCGQYGWDLNAHHIFSYKDYEDRRLDVSNGITLCEFCHKWYHWEYGSHYETPQDFYNYMEW